MYGLKTLDKMHDELELQNYVRENPLSILNNARDSKSSPDYSEVDIELLERAEGLECVDTFFVDNSGLGQVGEMALRYERFEKKLQELIHKSDKQLYSCLTGIGQFQVYVSIFQVV